VWINGHKLGRYWSIGPKHRLYCPASWLNPGDLQIDGRLPAGFIEGIQQPAGLIWNCRVQALSFPDNGVEGIVDPVFAAEGLVALFHGSLV